MGGVEGQSWVDRNRTIMDLPVGFSVPVFVVGYHVLAYVFRARLEWLPVPRLHAARPGVLAVAANLILPAVALGCVYNRAGFARINPALRCAVLQQDV